MTNPQQNEIQNEIEQFNNLMRESKPQKQKIGKSELQK